MIYISGIIYFCPSIKTLINFKNAWLNDLFFILTWVHAQKGVRLFHAGPLSRLWVGPFFFSNRHPHEKCSRGVDLPIKHQSPTRSRYWLLPPWDGLLWPFYACVPRKWLCLAQNSHKELILKVILVVTCGIGKCLSYFTCNWYCIWINWHAFGDVVVCLVWRANVTLK